jgi:hypothetical protein
LFSGVWAYVSRRVAEAWLNNRSQTADSPPPGSSIEVVAVFLQIVRRQGHP